MFCGSSSKRSEFVADHSAALEQPYAPEPGIHASTEATLTIVAASSAATSFGTNPRVTRSGPKKLVSMVASMSSIGDLSSDCPASRPALLTMIVASAAVSARADTDDSTVTSSATLAIRASSLASGVRLVAVSYTHLTLPTKRIV